MLTTTSAKRSGDGTGAVVADGLGLLTIIVGVALSVGDPDAIGETLQAPTNSATMGDHQAILRVRWI